MYALHLARMRSSEVTPGQPDPSAPVFMFGNFEPGDTTSSTQFRALDEEILGIMEDGALLAIAAHKHGHATAAADEGSSAFMFAGDPEQPSPSTPNELLMCLHD